jgi:tetratricopeptide (TPR) repeat protein
MFYLRWYLITFLGISWLLTGCGASKKTAEAIKEESSKSVVLISHSKGFGTGFFIDGEAGICTVITAKHVVPKGADISIQSVTSKLPWKPLSIQRSNNVDLAMMTFKPLDGNCPFPALKMGDSNNLLLTQTIYISSYPGGVNGQPVKQSFYISSIADKTPGTDGYEIGYKADTSGGTSGSPVLNEYGVVTAVHGRSYLSKDFVDPTGSSRAYLDLGIPINVYKQDAISKVETHKTGESRSSTSPVVGLFPRNSPWFAVLMFMGLLTIIITWVISNNIYLKISSILVVIILFSFFIDNMSRFSRQTVADYDELIRQNPKYIDAYFHRAAAKLNLGKMEDAIIDLDKIIELDPNYGEAYLIKCMIELDSGREKEAIVSYNKGIKLIPSAQHRWNFYLKKASIDIKLGNKQSAVNDYDKAIEALPNIAYMYRARAKIKIDLGRENDAINDYNKAIELDPNYSFQYSDRGKCPIVYRRSRVPVVGVESLSTVGISDGCSISRRAA